MFDFERQQLIVLAKLSGLSFWTSAITGNSFLKHGNHWSLNGHNWHPDLGVDGDVQAMTPERHYRLLVKWRDAGCPLP